MFVAAALLLQAMEPNSGSARPYFKRVRRFRRSFILLPLCVNWLKPLHYVIAAALITRARPFTRPVQIHADPALITDLFQYAMAGRKIDVSIAQIIDALKELRSGRILLVDLAIRQDNVCLRISPASIFVVHEYQPALVLLVHLNHVAATEMQMRGVRCEVE